MSAVSSVSSAPRSTAHPHSAHVSCAEGGCGAGLAGIRAVELTAESFLSLPPPHTHTSHILSTHLRAGERGDSEQHPLDGTARTWGSR